MSSKSKIYTKTGDNGTTSLYGGSRVTKDHPLIEAYGTVDELNSAVGILISHLSDIEKELPDFLLIIQADLLRIGSYLAGKDQSLNPLLKRVIQMEKIIDKLEVKLPVIKNFILPTGSPEAAHAHLARTICRRTERKIVGLSKTGEKVDKVVLKYFNRLSDLLFVLARFLNKKSGKDDLIWKTA